MKRRICSVVLSLVLVIGMLTACGGKEEEKAGTTSSGKKQITMWFWGAATDYQETMKDVLYSWYNESQDEYELSIEF